MKKLLNKLNKRGETLVEALAAMMVITLGMTMLAGAVVASANANRQAENAVSSIKSETPPVVLTPAPSASSYSVKVWSDGTTEPTPTPLPTIPVMVIQRGNDASAVYSYELISPAITSNSDPDSSDPGNH